MLTKLKELLAQIPDVKGGTFVDVFAVIFIVRLLGPLWGLHSINTAEAMLWGSTIASFAYGHGNGPKDGQA
jgi:hypothetical protein